MENLQYGGVSLKNSSANSLTWDIEKITQYKEQLDYKYRKLIFRTKAFTKWWENYQNPFQDCRCYKVPLFTVPTHTDSADSSRVGVQTVPHMTNRSRFPALPLPKCTQQRSSSPTEATPAQLSPRFPSPVSPLLPATKLVQLQLVLTWIPPDCAPQAKP